MMKLVLNALALGLLMHIVLGKTAFEKLTEYDYRGSTYYTIRNLSLWECQGWCREEPECAAASFSFVLNPLAPVQETLCLLQNETLASNPSAKPQRAVSLYYMVKLHVNSENVCNRPWTFERVPNKKLKSLDSALIFTSTKEACLAACLNEKRFTCRSCEYNYVMLQCHMSKHDRRSVKAGVGDKSLELEDASGIDYFENLCLGGSQTCIGARNYEEPQIGVGSRRMAHYVNLHYYVDKELMANSPAACKRACEIEQEFLCRSFLYKGPPTGSSYNCKLYHMDHFTLPDGASTFSLTDRPLFDNGDRAGQYFENVCIAGAHPPAAPEPETTISPSDVTPSVPGTATPSGPDSPVDNCDHGGVCYDVSVHCKDTRIIVKVKTSRPFNGRIYALGRSETCNIDVFSSDQFRLDLTMAGQDCNTQSIGGVYTNTVVIQHHSVVMTKTDKIYKVRCTYDTSSQNITFGMMPIRDPDMIPITSAPEAPPPKIRILDASLKEVETVRIGDVLTFRIEIPAETPYGIFARSCVAMAKDSRSTFQIIDDDGCPVEPAIFPHFTQDGSALQAVYEAFRFTESYGVIFQCNVKYCLGECQSAKCRTGGTSPAFVRSYGRRRRSLSGSRMGEFQSTTKEAALLSAQAHSVRTRATDEMSISQEILVLDLGDEQSKQYKKTTEQYMQDNYFKNTTFKFENPDVQSYETCPTRSSVLALAVTCAILLLIYVLTVFYFVMKKWMSPPKRIR